jgi:putative DNA primase/helicase
MYVDPVVWSLAEFLVHPFPRVEYVVEPWLSKRGIAMVSAWRGTGKTYFSLGLAYAIATGGTFLDFKVPVPRKVLYVDGEMDPAELQQRLAATERAAIQDRNGDPSLAHVNLRIFSHAGQELGIPDLADPDDDTGRKMVEKALDDADVLILDNISSLCRSGDENDAESWAVMQQWLVGLRRKDKTSLLVHHTGKPKGKNSKADQRGTSKREDVLNTSIRLTPKQGERGLFTFSITKSRGFKAPDDFTVMIEHDEGTGLCRLVREPQELQERVATMKAEGVMQKDIAERLGISGSTVSRIVKRLQAPPPDLKKAA